MTVESLAEFFTERGIEHMNPIKLVATLLIVAGVLGLAYGSFSYTKDTNLAKVGPIELNAQERHTVNIPVWAGIGGIVIGGLLLALGGKKD
jgi:hypothetical protein